MSLIGAMIGKDCILVFSDTRIIINEKLGRYENNKKYEILSKIKHRPTVRNVRILVAGDNDVYNLFKTILKIQNFDNKEFENILSNLNKKDENKINLH